MKDRCFLSAPERPHALGTGVGCIMCDGKRREDSRRHEGAVAVGIQKPAIARGEVSA